MNLSLGSDELVVDHWLDTGLNAGDVVSHWVEASLGWVDLDDLFKLGLASLQLLLPGLAVWLALFEQEWLGVLTLLEHG